MDLYAVSFYFFALLTLASAAIMVFSRNVIHSAVGLLFSFFGVAAIYVLLSADLLAVIQLLVYVGGILVLLLFGVMLTQRITNIELRSGTFQLLPAVIVVIGVLVVLIRVAVGTGWNIKSGSDYEPTTEAIGRLLMTDYLIPFEVASIILLAALIGAAFIARKES
jgi:NADH-quinone oxidoreductase subunit J